MFSPQLVLYAQRKVLDQVAKQAGTFASGMVINVPTATGSTTSGSTTSGSTTSGSTTSGASSESGGTSAAGISISGSESGGGCVPPYAPATVTIGARVQAMDNLTVSGGLSPEALQQNQNALVWDGPRPFVVGSSPWITTAP